MRTSPTYHRTPVRITVRTMAFILALGLLLAACQTMAPQSTETFTTPRLLAEANAAFQAERWGRSELYYSRLADRPDLPQDQRPLVLGRLAESALEAGHEHQARMALDSWLALDPQASAQPLYRELEARTLFGLGQEEAVQAEARQVVSDPTMAWKQRAETVVLYAQLYLKAGRDEEAADLLALFYDQASSDEERSVVERLFYASLHDLAGLQSFVAAIPAEQRLNFPAAVALFDLGRRQAEEEADPAPGLATMQDVLSRSTLVDKLFFAEVMHRLGGGAITPGLKVALAVPVTGRYQDVGRKIVRGAGAAQWALTQAGIDVTVKVVNTDATGWTERLAALPEDCMVVGGPLTVDGFKLLSEAGLTAQRAVFAFLPGLGEHEEGQEAWRFFPSREDEVRSLVSLARDGLGITRFGVLYPEEDFGMRMMEAFEHEVILSGGQVVGNVSYPPGDHPEWGHRVAELLDRPAMFDKDAPLPPPPFGAVFLPDGWTQAQLLVPNFFYYDAADVVYLGPNLWSRALEEVTVEEHYYQLAVCPGTWWPDSTGAQGLQMLLDEQGLGEADFWVALGHDFVRVAAALGQLDATWTPDELNQRLARTQDIPFSLAPVSWDGQGHARQDLFLFSPGEEGKTLANTEALLKGIARAKAKRDKRKQVYQQQQRENNQ